MESLLVGPDLDPLYVYRNPVDNYFQAISDSEGYKIANNQLVLPPPNTSQTLLRKRLTLHYGHTR